MTDLQLFHFLLAQFWWNKFAFGVLNHAEFIFYTKSVYFDEKSFKLQFWLSEEKLLLCDLRKFDKIGQPLKIFLYDGTIQFSKNYSVYLYEFTAIWKIVNFSIKVILLYAWLIFNYFTMYLSDFYETNFCLWISDLTEFIKYRYSFILNL